MLQTILYILAIILSALYYLDSLTKLFLDLYLIKFLDTLGLCIYYNNISAMYHCELANLLHRNRSLFTLA